MKTAPYGEWLSPITTELILADTVRLNQPRISGRTVYWVEERPSEEGRGVLVRWTGEDGAVDLTPPLYSVRSRAHEYGGGAYLAAAGRHWFVNDRDQNIYEAFLDRDPLQVTDTEDRRYADLMLTRDGDCLVCVVEDHSGPDEPANRLVSINLADGSESVLSDDHDFYSNPTQNPVTGQLAWLSWDHPNLPWNETRLWTGTLTTDNRLENVERVPVDAGTSVFLPRWSPDGVLYFVADTADWWNIHRYADNGVENVCQRPAEFGLPQWQFGMSTYGFAANDEIIVAQTSNTLWRLSRLDTESGRLTDLSANWTAVEHVYASDGCAVVIAGAPDKPRSLVLFDLSAGTERVLRVANQGADDAGYVSVPKAIRFPTGNGDSAHALFYPPVNKDYSAPGDDLPPLIVNCHGGPTAATNTAQKLGVQYWTSRGFAVADVNYRGSTGYGRAYREKLFGQWGVADVEDCAAAAQYLAAEGRVDGNRMTISGGSAGGYTVLCALTFGDTFKAGASHFGIGDLDSMFATTHKFEAHYDHWLLGPRDRTADLMKERSPAGHAHRIDCPVIFFQGLEDKVVPPSQSEMMVKALRDKGVPVAYLSFEKEGHGFRSADAIKATIEGELVFFGRVLGFKPHGPLPEIHIHNLDD